MRWHNTTRTRHAARQPLWPDLPRPRPTKPSLGNCWLVALAPQALEFRGSTSRCPRQPPWRPAQAGVGYKLRPRPLRRKERRDSTSRTGAAGGGAAVARGRGPQQLVRQRRWPAAVRLHRGCDGLAESRGADRLKAGRHRCEAPRGCTRPGRGCEPKWLARSAPPGARPSRPAGGERRRANAHGGQGAAKRERRAERGAWTAQPAQRLLPATALRHWQRPRRPPSEQLWQGQRRRQWPAAAAAAVAAAAASRRRGSELKESGRRRAARSPAATHRRSPPPHGASRGPKKNDNEVVRTKSDTIALPEPRRRLTARMTA